MEAAASEPFLVVMEEAHARVPVDELPAAAQHDGQPAFREVVGKHAARNAAKRAKQKEQKVEKLERERAAAHAARQAAVIADLQAEKDSLLAQAAIESINRAQARQHPATVAGQRWARHTRQR